MITYLPKSSYKKMPWKNGKGMTAQIALGPDESAEFPTRFTWRVSSAEVNSNDPFSIFAGCERLLMVTRGNGLTLNGKVLHPLQIFHFSGETPVDAKLLEGPVVDLGVIFRPEDVYAKMEVLDLATTSKLNVEGGIHFIYCLRGKLSLGDLQIHAEDAVKIENTAVIELDGLNHSQYVLISIIPK